MQKSGSRIPAATVAPVVIEGVSYEQMKNGLQAGLDQMGGFLQARNVASGEVLWVLGRHDEARKYFDEARGIDPENRSLIRALETTGA